MAQTYNKIRDFEELQPANTNIVRGKYYISCQWLPLREQILLQWPEITPREIEVAGPNLKFLSTLISTKYNLNQVMVQNYLRNVERYLPLA